MTESVDGPAVAARRAPTGAVLRSRLQLHDLEPAGKRVLVRADFNVPVHDGRVVDDTRIVATLPTLRHLVAAGARVVIASHRGRPRGERDPEASLAPILRRLQELGLPVTMVDDCVGSAVEEAVAGLDEGRLLLLENLRFRAGERENAPDFSARLAALADIYVNDAFGVSHREHASIVGVPALLVQAAAGDLLRREVERLSRVLIQPESPFVLVLGGAKVEDKVALIGNLLPLVDRILIGGAMANAFLAAEGRAIGGSLAPRAAIEEAGRLVERARAAGVELVLPSDLVAAPGIDRGDAAHVVHEVAPDEMALDIGPESADRYAEALSDARTVVWNGPMGVFEEEAFAAGSQAVAQAVARLSGRAYTVVGGGDTAAAAVSVADSVSHVSTGGGASLDLLSGSILPGVAALSER